MLEEEKCVMEKKGSRQSSVPPPKGNGPSADKKNDNSSKYPRYKKRESNGRGGSDNGNSRKPPPQKWGSTSDKRPRSRTSNTFDRQREEVVQSYQEEYGSMYGPKKGNLNHLLNFSFAPREVDAFVGGSVRRTKTSRVKFDKKRFLQANCQFIVKDTGDYSLHAADPDILVDWDLVELVRLYSHNEPACPICMDTPIAAKVTRCGHIYCWSCILHLLSLEDGSWAECPICYSPVLAKDLRSAESVIIKSYKIGDIITMKLMKRECGTNYSVPKDIWSDRQGKLHRYLEDVNVTKYMKLLVASASEILQHVVDREKTSLQTQLIDTEDSEVCFIETALAQLQEREKDLVMQALRDTSKCDKNAQQKREMKTEEKSKPTASSTGDIDRRVKTLSIGSATSDEYPEITAGRFKTFSESSVSDIEGSLESYSDISTSQSLPSDLGACAAEMIEDLIIPEESYADPEMTTDIRNANIHKPKNKHVYVSKNGYHCFQAEDGQQIYIHNLNSRCLTHEYGSLEQSPPSITAKIIDIRTMNMSEELRSRTKYLNHLPLSSEFQQVELDLKPPILSRPTLDLFHSEIDRKKKSRIRKEKSERQREKQISLEEDKRMGKYPELNISLKSEYQFPSHINSYNDHPVLSVQSPIVDGPVSPDITTPSPPDNNQSLSFAQMLRNGPTKSPVPAWPKLQSKASSSRVLKEEKTIEKTAVYIDSDGEELEDYTPVPEFKQSFGNALQAALDSAAAKSESKSAGKQKGGKKKKSKKVKLLFSTSMSRGATE